MLHLIVCCAGDCFLLVSPFAPLQAVKAKSFNGRECDIVMKNYQAIVDIVFGHGANIIAKAKYTAMFAAHNALFAAMGAFDDKGDRNTQADEVQKLADAYIERVKSATGQSSLTYYDHSLQTHMVVDQRKRGNLHKYSCQSLENTIGRLKKSKEHIATQRNYIKSALKRETVRLALRAKGMLALRLSYQTRLLYGLPVRKRSREQVE